MRSCWALYSLKFSQSSAISFHGHYQACFAAFKPSYCIFYYVIYQTFWNCSTIKHFETVQPESAYLWSCSQCGTATVALKPLSTSFLYTIKFSCCCCSYCSCQQSCNLAHDKSLCMASPCSDLTVHSCKRPVDLALMASVKTVSGRPSNWKSASCNNPEANVDRSTCVGQLSSPCLCSLPYSRCETAL